MASKERAIQLPAGNGTEAMDSEHEPAERLRRSDLGRWQQLALGQVAKTASRTEAHPRQKCSLQTTSLNRVGAPFRQA